MASTHAKVLRDRILTLNLGQLILLGSVALEQLCLLGVGDHLVPRHQHMLSNINEQLLHNEELEDVGGVHIKRLKNESFVFLKGVDLLCDRLLWHRL